MKLHGEEVKVGDKVWHLFRGWGEVYYMYEGSVTYPILVHWKDSDECYTEDGKFRIVDNTPVLFWQPIEFEIPKKPKQKEKAWQWICKSGNKYWLTDFYYVSKEAVLGVNYDAEPIEPYLPSEIERDKSE